MIKFFVNKHGHFNSHHQGLTLDQVAFVRSLKVQDKLVIWVNEDGSLTLKKAKDSNEKV